MSKRTTKKTKESKDTDKAASEATNSARSPVSKRLDLSGDFFYTLLDGASVGICISDENAAILEVNSAFLDIYGYERAEVVGSRITMLVEDSRADEVLHNHYEFFETGREPADTHRVKSKSGKILYIRVTGKLLKQDDGTLLKVTTIRNITDEMQTQEQLHAALSDLRERLKEQQYLQDIANMEVLNRAEAEIFEEASYIVKRSLTHPSHTKIRITYNDACYGDEISSIDSVYTSVSILSEHQLLKLTAACKKSPAPKAETVFPQEEKKMLDSVAGLLNVKLGRKMAVDAHRAANRDLRKILDYSLDVICTMDRQHRFVTVSAASKSVWGYTPEELEGRPFIEMVHEPDLKRTEEARDVVRAGRDLNEFVHRMIRKDGSVRTIQWSVYSSQQEEFIYCVAKDITERKEAEDKLALSAHRFRSLIQEGVEMICIVDDDGTYTYVSPSYLQILGEKPEDLIGENAFELIHSDDRDFIMSEFRKLGTGGKVRSSPYRIRHKDGHYIWMQSTGTNLLEDPAVKGFVINTININEIERARHKLMDSERKLKRATQISKIGYWQLNLRTGKLFWSDEVYGMWGVDKKTFSPGLESLLNSIHPEDREEFSQHQQKVLDEGRPLDADHRIIMPNGSVKWVRERAEITWGTDGKPAMLEGTVQDITEKKQEELDLRLLETVATSTGDGVLICEEENKSLAGLRILFANEAYTEASRYSRSDIIDDYVMFELSPNAGKPGIDRLDKAILDGKPAEETVLLLNKDRNEYWADLNFTPVVAEKNGDVKHWIITHRDVTRRKEQELRERFHADISGLFNKHDSLGETLNEMLRYLIIWSDFSMAEVWLVGADKKRINYITAHFVDADYSDYVADSHKIGSFAMNEGMPGTVWATGKPELWHEVHKSDRFVRKEMAERAGIKSAYAVPFMSSGEVIGVLMFSSQNEEKKINFYDRVMRELKGYLGREVRRKQIEEEMNSIFNVATDIFCIAGMDGYYKRINPAATRLTGFSEKEFLSTPLLDFIHPEDRERSVENFRHLLGGGEVEYFENRFITRKGDTIWLAWTASSVPEDGRIYAIAKDITGSKNLEITLDKATRLSQIGGWEVDLVNGEISWTGMMRELHEVPLSYQPEMQMGLSFFKEGESRELLQVAVDLALEKGESWDLELQLVTQKGNERWVRFIGEAEMRDGKCVRLFGSMQNINTRKTAELEAVKQASYLEAITRTIEIFLKAGDWEEALSEAFDITASILGADRMYLFEMEPEPEPEPGAEPEPGTGERYMLHAFSWSRENITSHADNPALKRIPLSKYEKQNRLFLNGETLLVYTDEADPEHKALLEALDIRSQIAVPFFIADEWVGFVSVDNCTNDRRWTDSEVSFLETIGKNLAAAYQRKENLEAIEKSNKEKHTILETIGDGFFTTNEREIVTYWNGVAEDTTGILREEIVGKKLWSVFNDEDALKLKTKIEESNLTTGSLHTELYYTPLKMWTEVSIYLADGAMAVYFRNINERKMTEQTLRESNERFEKTSQATNDAIWDLDLASDRLRWGAGFEKLFGYPPNENLSPKFFRSLIHPDDKEQVEQVVTDALSSDADIVSSEFRFRKPDGTYAYVTDRASLVRNDEGEVVRLIGAMADITQRREYENSLRSLNQALEQRAHELVVSNQELEQFAYVASHDLQEPLRMVSSFLTQLERKYGEQLDERAHTYIHFAVDGSKRMRQIILDLLEYSRAGKETDEIELLDLNELLGEVLLLSNKRITEQDAEITVEVLPQVLTLRSPLLQVFQNLIGNAIKYTRPGVKPEISVRHHPGHKEDEWLFSVTDNGLGIKKEYYEKIFIIFKRLHGKDEFSGTGMGLAIVKKIIETLGGKIWVESEEGRGSTFYFTLKKKLDTE